MGAVDLADNSDDQNTGSYQLHSSKLLLFNVTRFWENLLAKKKKCIAHPFIVERVQGQRGCLVEYVSLACLVVLPEVCAS